jgi:hypothetical protein
MRLAWLDAHSKRALRNRAESKGISLHPAELAIEAPVPGRVRHRLSMCKTGNIQAPGGTIMI